MEDRINIALRLTAAARCAINGDDFHFSPADYMDSVKYKFMPRGRSVFGGFSARYAEQWFDHLVELGLREVWADFDHSGGVPAVVCGFEDGSFSRFEVAAEKYKHRTFASDVGPSHFLDTPFLAVRWSWSYAQWDCIRAQATEKPSEPYTRQAEDNSSALRAAFVRAEELLMRLTSDSGDCCGHARIFSEAVQILDGKDIPRVGFPVSLPSLPDDKLRIYRACEHADVHDVRFCWNGHPAHIAQELDMNEEFTKITAELLKQTENALLYSVNTI